MNQENRNSDLITVVVPVYNMCKYLDRAMNSLLNQSYTNYELLIVDDGSTDGGAEKCDKYALEYDNVKVLHKKNGGLSSARNYGIKNAKGKYIIFPDPDDWVSEEYLQELVNLRDENSDLEICGHYVVTDESERRHSFFDNIYTYNREESLKSAMLSKGFCGFAATKMFHMNIILENKLLFDEELGMAQDLHFLIRYLMFSNKVVYSTKPLYYYYQHIGGVTNAPLSSRKLSGLKSYEKIAEITEKVYPQIAEMAKATYANMSLQFIYIYYEYKMNDDILLNKLILAFRKNIKYFMKNENCDLVRKILGMIGFVSPKVSYICRKRLREKRNYL